MRCRRARLDVGEHRAREPTPAGPSRSIVLFPRAVGLPLPGERAGELPLRRPLFGAALADEFDLPGAESDPGPGQVDELDPSWPGRGVEDGLDEPRHLGAHQPGAAVAGDDEEVAGAWFDRLGAGLFPKVVHTSLQRSELRPHGFTSLLAAPTAAAQTRHGVSSSQLRGVPGCRHDNRWMHVGVRRMTPEGLGPSHQSLYGSNSFAPAMTTMSGRSVCST